MRMHALIGDTQTAGLVGRDGSLDWLCLPRFDSAVASPLSAEPEHGRWLLAPEGEVLHSSSDTATGPWCWRPIPTADGVVAIIDFMPLRDPNPTGWCAGGGPEPAGSHDQGAHLRMDYGHDVPWVRRASHGMASWPVRTPSLCLDIPSVLKGVIRSRADFDVAAGDVSLPPGLAPVAPEHAGPARPRRGGPEPRPSPGGWSGAIAVHDVHGDPGRSAWTLAGVLKGPHLRAHRRHRGRRRRPRCPRTSAASATGTTATAGCATPRLPYGPDGAGFIDEALALAGLAACGRSPAARAAADHVRARRRAPPHRARARLAAGLREPTPVRIGNAASDQFQLDVYGEVLDAAPGPPARHRVEPGSVATSQLALAGVAGAAWTEPDDGIWEVRGPRRHFTHSKVMAWVAFDRAIKPCEDCRADGPGRPLAPPPRRHHMRGLRPRARPDPALRAVLRLEASRRQPAA